MSGPVSEEELQRALRTIMAAGRGDLLTGQGLKESEEGVGRPQRAAAAGVAAAIMACESPSSGSEGGRLSDALKGKKGGAGGSKGKGPAKKQRRDKEAEDVQERTNRVLEALREEERRQKERFRKQESGEEGDEELEELEEGEYAEEEAGLGYGLEESDEEGLAGEEARQGAVGGDQVVSRPNPPVFVVPQPAKERPVVADTVAAVTSGVERPLEVQQAGAGGYNTGELKEEVLKVWGEVLKKKEQQWEDKLEQQWAAHEKERKIMKMVNDEYCVKQQKERAFMRNKSEELCNAMQGRLDQVEELCAGLRRNNDMLEKKLWEEQGGGREKVRRK